MLSPSEFFSVSCLRSRILACTVQPINMTSCVAKLMLRAALPAKRIALARSPLRRCRRQPPRCELPWTSSRGAGERSQYHRTSPSTLAAPSCALHRPRLITHRYFRLRSLRWRCRVLVASAGAAASRSNRFTAGAWMVETLRARSLARTSESARRQLCDGRGVPGCVRRVHDTRGLAEA
jgi:hypothetical protein